MNAEKTIPSLVGRLDRFEVRLDQHGRDITGLRRDVDSLTEATRVLLDGGDPDTKGQPDWLAIRDPDLAEDILVGALAFADSVLPWLDATLTGCWPWHPASVVEVLAFAEQWRYGYAAKDPSKVSDLLSRWLPGFRNRTRTLLKDCATGEHRTDRGAYLVDLSAVPDLARWWATTRTGTAPGLKERD